jgi:hypothetical protein
VKTTGPDTTIIKKDTIKGWVSAGLKFTDDGYGVYNIKLIGNRLFCRTFNGFLYRNTIGSTEWELVVMPESKKFWCMNIRDNFLLLGSTDGFIYEYDCTANSFRLISPRDVSFWADTIPTDSFCRVNNVIYCDNYYYTNIVAKRNGNYQTMWFYKPVNDTLWSRIDVGWSQNVTTTYNDYVYNDKIYVCTFGDGLWEFNGTKWRNVPGTIPYDPLTDQLNLGLSPRSMVLHNGALYVGFLGSSGGPVARLNSDDSWEHMKRVYFPPMAGVPGDTVDYWGWPYHLFSHNGILFNSSGGYYRDFKDSLWRLMMYDDDSTVWINENAGDLFVKWVPAGTVLEMVGVGDTLFAAVSADRIPCKGAVYKLDLNKCKWYRKYKANGYRW